MGRRKKKTLGKKFLRAVWTINKTIVAGVFKGAWFVVKNIGRCIALSTIFIASKMQKVQVGTKKISVTDKKRSLPKIFQKHHPAKFVPLEIAEETKGEFAKFEKRMTNKSMIIAIAGKRGSGKSTLGFRLLENIHAKTKRPCFVIGVKQGLLPHWISSVENVSDVKNNGVVLVDEGAISFGSRNSMSKKNKQLGELMAIARHKNLSLLLVTQNTGMLDKNVLNLTDALLFKKGSLLQTKMERSAVKKLYETAEDAFEKIDEKSQISHFYVFDSDFEGMLKGELPSFWNEKISKNQA